MCSGKSLYDYNDEDFSKKPIGGDAVAAIAMVPLQERKRKKNYNESDYYRDLQSADHRAGGGGSRPAKPKSIAVRSFWMSSAQNVDARDSGEAACSVTAAGDADDNAVVVVCAVAVAVAVA